MAIRSRAMLLHHIEHITLIGLRPRTISSRQLVLTAFAQFIHPRSLASATRRDIESFLSRPHLSASSRRNYLMHIRGLYGWAVEEELIEEDPTAKIKRITVKRGTPRPLSGNDLAVALDHAVPRMRAWLLLFSLAGLRCMEVAALRPCDILELDGQTFLYLRECKGGGSATLPAHPAILEALSVLHVRDGLWWDLQPKTVSAEVSQYLHGLGINASAHALRHSAATSWIRASGHDLLTTSFLMRHANVATTQVYAQMAAERPAEVVKLVAVPTLPRQGSVPSTAS